MNFIMLTLHNLNLIFSWLDQGGEDGRAYDAESVMTNAYEIKTKEEMDRSITTTL